MSGAATSPTTGATRPGSSSPSQLGAVARTSMWCSCRSTRGAARPGMRSAWPARLTGRPKVLVPQLSDPERLSGDPHLLPAPEMASHIDVVVVAADPTTGRLDLDDLTAKLGYGRGGGLLREPGAIWARSRPSAAEIARRPARQGPRPSWASIRSEPGRDDGTGRLWRGHRDRPGAAARRSHAMRWRRRRLHRLARRGALRARVQRLSRLHRGDARSRGRGASASPARIRTPTDRASTARTGPAIPPISGPSPAPST